MTDTIRGYLCPKCGNRMLSEGWLQCPRCGVSLSESTPPKPAHIDTTAPVVTYVPTPSPIDTTGQELANQFCDEMIQNLRRNVPASIATTQGEPCPECRWSDGFGHAPLCSQSREPTPAPQAEAQESFEEWWKDGEVIQRLPPASESFDKAIARLTWNAQQAKIEALEQEIGELEREVGGLKLSNKGILRTGSQMLEKAESRIAELEEKLREGK